ncbi:cation:proton antiporter [Lentilactobacillus kisonensis]|uniref:cation:proton antiporter n=2 Tax=Lentilactobacillus kisonensis TaxID=481722 RepID=UPI00058FCE88|nr:sodium:proton antiporter [Lentilactobacillus kisonensis]
MEVFYSVALLIVAAIISNMIYPIFPKVPLTFYQIGCGLVLSLLPIFNHFSLFPEIFMLGIIAPLMFNDGQNTDSNQFRRSIGHIFSMAVYLAISTSVAIGGLAHVLMPAIPLALCFALAAIVTPTDSVALKSITQSIQVPANVHDILESESLFNDASGIVIFNLAVTAFFTGNFSLTAGLTKFIVSFFGGILVGLIAGILFVKLRTFLVNQSMDTTSVIVPFSIMTPFAIYLISEMLGCSGILAVVSAGIMHGVNQSQLKLTSTNVRLVTNATWQIIANLLNGIVFVLLGVTLPTVINQIMPYSDIFILELVGFGAAIYLFMALLRFFWVKFNLVQTNHHRDATLKEALLTAVGGVHGTITLSMALSLPFTAFGKSFPYRNQLIFVATVVILLSLLVPTIVLPILLPKKKDQDQDTFKKYQGQMVNYAISKVKNDATISLVDRNYIIDMLNSQKNNPATNRKEIREIMNRTKEIEAQVVVDALSQGQISQQFANIFSRRIVATSGRGSGFWKRLQYLFRLQTHRFKKRTVSKKEAARRIQQYNQQRQRGQGSAKFNQMVEKSKQIRQMSLMIEDTSFKRVNNYLDSNESETNTTSVNFVRNGYNFRHLRFDNSDEANARREHLLVQAFQYEYTYVADSFKAEKISRNISDQLNQSISTDQMVFMQSDMKTA